MEIQSISGFHLAATTVTPADGRPPSRPNRHRSVQLPSRYRTAETRTIDFRHGLETYMPPRVVKRPNSSEGQRNARSKAPAVQYVHKDTGRETRETSFDIMETERELEAMANADIKQNIPPKQLSNTEDDEVPVTLKGHEKVFTPSSPESTIKNPSIVCTCNCYWADLDGTESKRHGDHTSSQESRAWFERTLQEYEDLKKSVEAHISSTPSLRNEFGPDMNPRLEKLFWKKNPLQDKAYPAICKKDADEVYRKSGYMAKMSQVGSPAQSNYSCGCPTKSFPNRSPPIVDMDAVQDAAWGQMVDTVAQLRETNRALQQTVQKLHGQNYNSKRYDVGALAEMKANSFQYKGESIYEPELRKRVLGTLKSSVNRMESLMVALRDEQEKSRKLRTQLQEYLSASKDKTPEPTPPRSAPGSRSTSPVERCVRSDYSHQFSAISPACATWAEAQSPEQSKNAVCRCDHDSLHHTQASPPTKKLLRSQSPARVLCRMRLDSPIQNSQNIVNLSATDVIYSPSHDGL